MFIIYNLLKVKQTNDLILSVTSQIPLLNNFLQRFLILFGATLEHVAERIRPDDRTLSELERRKSKKFFTQLPRFESDPSLKSQPDVIGNDQHVFPARSYGANNLYARLAANAVPVTVSGNRDIDELRQRIRPTDIVELHGRNGTDVLPGDANDEPLTEDQLELYARVNDNDSD